MDKCEIYIEDEEDLSFEVFERFIFVFIDNFRDVESFGIGWKDDSSSGGEVIMIKMVDVGEFLL